MFNLKLHHSDKYANVIIRVIAWKIDMLVLNLPFLFVIYVMLSQPNITDGVTNFFYLVAYVMLPLLFVQFLYHFYCISTWGKTLGKAIVGLEVADDKGKLLTRTQAFMRENVTKGVSAVLLGVGFWAVAFNRNHQAWHDEFVGSYVYKKENRWLLGLLAVFGLIAVYAVVSVWLFQMAVTSPLVGEIKTYLPF
ncbi:MAG TPA: RDD family protein [Patescibacteria group bacterium]